MRVLLDENIDRLLKPLFAAEFVVITVRERGWQGKSNGELLRAAEQEFDAVVTMDTNIGYQQNLQAFKLRFIVIHAASNTYSAVAPLMPKVNDALRAIKAGEVLQVSAC